MNEFFSLLETNTFARVFIATEVWVSFVLGYLFCYLKRKLDEGAE